MRFPFPGVLALLLASFSLQAQFGPGPGGSPAPNLTGPLAEIFGSHKAFTATTVLRMRSPADGNPLTVTAQLSYLDGSSRFEMDMTKMQGAGIPPQAAAQMKAMGMSKMTILGGKDPKDSFMVYPDLKAYAPLPNADQQPKDQKFELERTDLGDEEVDGHPCLKQKVKITGPDNFKQELIVWLAKDMKEFPVQLEFGEGKQKATMLFKEVNLKAPEAKLFKPDSTFKKYDTVQALMTEVMFKRLGQQ